MRLKELLEEKENDIISTIENSDHPYMVILIGPPASGKSTFTEKLHELRDDVEVCSTDDFFMKDGRYEFDVSKLGSNHQKNFQKSFNAMKRHHSIVVIDNTNLSISDFKEYVKGANTYHYKVLFKIFQVDRDELIRRTEKRFKETGKEIGVEVIDRMLTKMNDNLPAIESFIAKYNAGQFTETLNESSKVVYVGIFFDVSQIVGLSKQFNLNIRPTKILALPHITLYFNKDKKTKEELGKTYSFGKEVSVKVRDFVEEPSSGHSAFTCETSEKINQTPHITTVVGVGKKPVYSNEMIKSGSKDREPINKTITGRIGYFDGSEVKYE